MFGVRACHSARIALSTFYGNTDTQTYEVVIGGWENTKTVIRRSVAGDIVEEVDTPDILSCDHLRIFWIKQERDGLLQIGEGSNIGNNVVLSWNDADPYDVASVSLSTGHGARGEWQVLHVQGEPTYNYTWFVTERTSISFKVKTCADAHLALSTDPMDVSTNTYEVIIGGWENTRSSIRRGIGGDQLQTASTPDVLSCDELRLFWVSWQEGRIRAGQGNSLDHNILVEWVDPEPMGVGIISVTTGWGSTGEWEFANILGKNYLLWALRISYCTFLNR
ncbi:hypothetical protein CAPTEDRAFT_114549 [Capitella teleta]|uniref:Farnesoic acid O-methyl transferase domain-containing protein n=1 Tax=Capitella teleta TaxID=283909 RepID=R7V348_CAPTE|nr:hypothetical protein CAPTEDRAFT_114549 [Capitella teleta]|eukprot:ELU12989.1 hypothetical protein CAPTEDRAFT_114549 [Capitella teleta]